MEWEDDNCGSGCLGLLCLPYFVPLLIFANIDCLLLALLLFFSRESDSTTTNVQTGCGYIKTRMRLYSNKLKKLKSCSRSMVVWLMDVVCDVVCGGEGSGKVE